jgi:serine protease Do
MAPRVLASVNLKSVFAAVLLLSRAAAADSLKPEEIYQKLLPSVVTVQVENSEGEKFVGSGFLALGDGVAVTAWHVISDATRVTVKFSDDRVVAANGVIDKDEKHDLALIKLEPTGRPQVHICASNPPVGARAYVIGTPKGFEFSIADGLISQIQLVDGFTQYQVSCPISGGNSGGPLVNERGEVVGITCWTKKDAQNLSFATPASFLSGLKSKQTLYRQWSTNAPLAFKTAPASTAGEAQSQARSPEPANSVAELKGLLKKSAGHEVTVVVIDDHGEEKRFDIVVPDDLVK